MNQKFRAWDEDSQKMNGNVEIYIAKDKTIEVRPKDDKTILMQYTGLKDKKGEEIFEGDVVKCYTVTEEDECEYVGVVRFKDFSFVIVDKKDTYDPLWNYKGGFVAEETEIEIIGDIYRNPELLRG